MKRFTADNFTGCLVGGAAGDALGYFVEFSTIEDIKEQYGETGLRDFSQTGGQSFISDDTQMTLFTANGLLYYYSCGKYKNMDERECMYSAYKDWLDTQNEYAPAGREHVSWIYGVKRLHERRSPGGTCISALSGGSMGSVRNRINNSKGCGGIMRVAPAGMFADTPEKAAHLGAEAAAITHGHPLGFIPAAAYAYIIHKILYTDDSLIDCIAGCVKMIRKEYGSYPEAVRIINLIAEAVMTASDAIMHDDYLYSENFTDDVNNIEKLGGGWVAEETLAVALYCCLKYDDDIESALAAAVNHSGDSDSTASVTGAILGALHGNSGMPAKYVFPLEMYDLISEIGKDMFIAAASSGGDIQTYEKEWHEKYIDRTYCID